MKRFVLASTIAALCLLVPSTLPACQIIGKINPEHVCDDAQVIVRAVAVRYSNQPTYREDGTWEWGQIEFEVREILKGQAPAKLIIEGELTSRDDYNEPKVPYTFVRHDGRSGSCYARRYRGGAEFLLFLKEVDGALTPYWAALAPTNEQLVRPEVRPLDPWLAWVKKYLGIPLQ